MWKVYMASAKPFKSLSSIMLKSTYEAVNLKLILRGERIQKYRELHLNLRSDSRITETFVTFQNPRSYHGFQMELVLLDFIGCRLT